MFHWYCILNADVDECIGEVYPCDPNASCNNSIGSFSCTCLTGYSGNGMTCTGKPCVFVRHILDGCILTNCFCRFQ